MSRVMPRRGRGTLHVIAGLLLVSAVVRVGATGTAMAESPNAVPPVAVPAVMVEPEATAEAAPESTLASGETGTLLVAFQQREARLAAREAQLMDRIQALRVAETEIAEQLTALEDAERKLSATIALADVAAEADIGTLVEVYENMKPKDAAELFEQMTPQFAAGFLAMMNPEPAAQIMTLVPPDVSYSISVVLAGRNANVPTQ